MNRKVPAEVRDMDSIYSEGIRINIVSVIPWRSARQRLNLGRWLNWANFTGSTAAKFVLAGRLFLTHRLVNLGRRRLLFG